METPKNLFSKAYNGLFGGSPLTNEPTIDYDNTINTFKTNTTQNGIRYWDDSDDDLNNDMSVIYNQFQENSTKLSGNSLGDAYPGRFRSYSRGSTRDIPDDTRLGFKPLESHRSKFYGKPTDLYQKPNATGSEGLDAIYSRAKNELGRDTKLKGFDKKPQKPNRDSFGSLLEPDNLKFRSERPRSNFKSWENRELENDNVTSKFTSGYSGILGSKLDKTAKNQLFKIYDDKLNKERQRQQSNNRDVITDFNTKLNQMKRNLQEIKELNQLNNQLTDNTKFLADLNDYIDMNKQSPLEATNFTRTSALTEESRKSYNDLRKEYLKELQVHQGFYEKYLNLYKKYNSLKEESRSNTSSKDLNLQQLKFVKKLKTIRDTTTEESIKKFCDRLLNDLN